MSALDVRSNSAVMKRAEQLKRWEESDTNREPPSPRPEKGRKIKFSSGCVFLAACLSGDKEEVVKLIENGADINTANVDGLTALHQACIDDNLEMVEFLVEHGADINRQDNEGWTPLHATASCGFVSIARYLVEHGADVSSVNSDGDLALDLAVDTQQMSIIEFMQKMVNEHNIDCEKARQAEEQLMLTDAKKWLRSDASEIDRPHPKTGATALHVAAAKGYTKVLSLLLAGRANVDKQDNDGWTPLHAAAHWSQKEAAQMLVDAMADMDLRNYAGQTCIDVAERKMVKFLEELRANNKRIKRRPSSQIRISDTIESHIENTPTKIIRVEVKQDQTKDQQNDEKPKLAMDTTTNDEEAPWRRNNSARLRTLNDSPIKNQVPEKEINKPAVNTESDVILRRTQSFENDEKFYQKYNELRARIKANSCPILPATQNNNSNNNNKSSNNNNHSYTHSINNPASVLGTTTTTSTKINQPTSTTTNTTTTTNTNTNTTISTTIHNYTVQRSASLKDHRSFRKPISLPVSSFTPTTATSETTTSISSTVAPAPATITTSSYASSANIIRRSFVPPTRDEESETQRKAHAKRVRETRRSTQGVTLDEIKSAEELVKKKNSSMNNNNNSNSQQEQATLSTTTDLQESLSAATSTEDDTAATTVAVELLTNSAKEVEENELKAKTEDAIKKQMTTETKEEKNDEEQEEEEEEVEEVEEQQDNEEEQNKAIEQNEQIENKQDKQHDESNQQFIHAAKKESDIDNKNGAKHANNDKKAVNDDNDDDITATFTIVAPTVKTRPNSLLKLAETTAPLSDSNEEFSASYTITSRSGEVQLTPTETVETTIIVTPTDLTADQQTIQSLSKFIDRNATHLESNECKKTDETPEESTTTTTTTTNTDDNKNKLTADRLRSGCVAFTPLPIQQHLSSHELSTSSNPVTPTVESPVRLRDKRSLFDIDNASSLKLADKLRQEANKYNLEETPIASDRNTDREKEREKDSLYGNVANSRRSLDSASLPSSPLHNKESNSSTSAAERRPSWRLKFDAGSKFKLEDASTGNTYPPNNSTIIPSAPAVIAAANLSSSISQRRVNSTGNAINASNQSLNSIGRPISAPVSSNTSSNDDRVSSESGGSSNTVGTNIGGSYISRRFNALNTSTSTATPATTAASTTATATANTAGATEQTANENKDDKDNDKENDNRSAVAAQGVIQRRRKPKRRSTGVVHLDMDDLDTERPDSANDNEEKESGSERTSRSRLSSNASAVSAAADDTKSRDKSENGEPIDYKALYEAAKSENDKLKQQLKKKDDEIVQTRATLERFTNAQLEVYKTENQRLKEENGALIRVISKLSK